MSQVLRRVEHSKSEAIQEFALGQKATDGFQTPASLRLKILTDVLKLGNVISFEALDVFLERSNTFVELFASVMREHLA